MNEALTRFEQSDDHIISSACKPPAWAGSVRETL
jgi:hypothetical protein